ncbi:NDP-hexose 2,3-dehydratase family protein [Streptomyces sedi]|uniref:NDP-hexose 2,3-dehydratase n=1 Tax=Streptomyces sedi TaxID=555059 RepID=A0A5C4VE23_9ACTN|nr:NDP-hexose 2,3-dehydratase family protein [Streptomyces sedi]TNM34194.1 NDP-hexose 2,3-dehydratase [Streptomyces sedi]
MAEDFPTTSSATRPSGRPADADADAVGRIAESSLAREGVVSTAEFREWYAERQRVDVADVRKVPLEALAGWKVESGTGNIAHESGRFFSVEGVDVRLSDGPWQSWSQPMIFQQEIGTLGLIMKRFGGTPHFLMQAKNEPGNHNGVQLSPTVQATRSNYTRVHRGSAVPYVEYFQEAHRHRLLTDVLQSEQGSWFYRKRNRNMVVEVEEDVEQLENFCWLTLGQISRLLAEDDVINMDSRTVLGCLPFAGEGAVPPGFELGDDLRSALARSCHGGFGALHPMAAIRRWLNDQRVVTELRTRQVPLNEVVGWERSEEVVEHEDRRFFRVVGVDVRSGSREVKQWTQPMIQPCGQGVIAFLVARFDGVLHALVNARPQPGFLDGVELAPTVQCTPSNYLPGPRPPHLRYLDQVLEAPADRIVFDSVHSEEGGRFYHARNRYLVVELDDGAGVVDSGGDDAFRWMTLNQLSALTRHSYYVNIEARSLTACLYSLFGATEELSTR